MMGPGVDIMELFTKVKCRECDAVLRGEMLLLFFSLNTLCFK